MSRDQLPSRLSDVPELAAQRAAPGRATLTQRLHRPVGPSASTAAPLDGAALIQRHEVQDHDLATAMGFFGAPAAPIQRHGDGHTGLGDDEVRAVAAQGVAGSGGALPHLDAIQRSFGDHDVGGVRAHVGGAAAEASAALGAEAYATGSSVAFGAAPSLFVAAHEAAHVVQQRGGVQFAGAVGQAGDAYEQHADAVAARVVAGESAADLLGQGARGAASTAVQRKDTGKPPAKADPKKEAAQFEAEGPHVVYALAGVFMENAEMRTEMPTRYQDALHKLLAVRIGHIADGRERRAMFDEAEAVFAPFVRANDHFGGADDYLAEHMKSLRETVVTAEAQTRISSTLVVNDGKEKHAIELPDDKHPREQAEVLGVTLPKLVESIKKTIERAKTLGEHTGVKAETLERLEVMVHILDVAGGYLKLNDAEFQKEVNNIKGVMNGVATYSELVKTILEIGAGAIGLTCFASAKLMKAVGDHAMAEACEHTGAAVSATLGKVVAAVEVVHGVAVMFDRNASTDDRIGGGVEAAAGVATLMTGSSLGALPIMGPYALIKAAQYLYSNAVIGWEAGFLTELFTWMQEQAQHLGGGIDQVAAAGLLAQDEKNAERRAALLAQEKSLTHGLNQMVQSFLDRCDGLHSGVGNEFLAHHPGNYTIVAEAFTLPVRHRHVTTEAEIITLVQEVMRQIVWCFNHGPAIVKGSATHKHVEDMDEMEEKMERDAKKKED
jgi:hypothetical protein